MNTLFQYVMPRSPVKSYQNFGETSCLHLQGIIYTVDIKVVGYSKTLIHFY